MDREKIINGLEACLGSDSCGKCQYHEYAMDCSWHLKYEALMLLKAQTRTIEQFEREREQQMWNMPPMGGFHDD